jgi:hypothetical protein
MSLTGITVFLLELPTSGFADAFGRKPVYVTAAVFLIALRRSSSTRRRPGGSSRWPRC